MNPARDRYAATLALVGALLGVAAGVAQTTAGHQLGAWAGAKNDPVPLGVLTLVLSLVAVAVALLARRAITSLSRRAALATGLAVPGLICFSTVGRLWWVPGVLLLTAAVLLVAAAPRAVARTVGAAWTRVLTSVLGACLALVAATADPPLLAVGLASGLAVAAAPWTARRSRAAAWSLLLLGAVPFAALTWSTMVTPLVAILAIAIGIPAIHSASGHAPAASRAVFPSPGPATR